MPLNAFEKNIKAIDFSFKTQKDEGGVILTSEYRKNKNSSNLSAQEIFALEIADKKFNADAVYFRYFNDGRESVPQIYIYDNTNDFITDKRKDDIHKKMWSGCYVPLFMIIDKTQVKIFDSRQKATEDGKAEAFEKARDECQTHGSQFGLAVIFLQVTILLSSIAGLLKKKPVWYLSLVVGAVGILFFLDGFFLFLKV